MKSLSNAGMEQGARYRKFPIPSWEFYRKCVKHLLEHTFNLVRRIRKMDI